MTPDSSRFLIRASLTPPGPSRLAAVLVAVAAAVLAGAHDCVAQTLAVNLPPPITTGDQVVVTGEVQGVPAGQEDDFRVYVQGIAADLQPMGNVLEFSVEVPVGPTPPAGGFHDAFPYVAFYLEPNRLVLPMVAELWQESAGRVIERRKGFVFDLRLDVGTLLAAPSGTRQRLGVQITSRGIDRLEPTFLSTLPYPDRATFNERLLARYTAPHQEYAPSTGYFESAKVCVPMEEASPAFQQTNAFTTLKLAAGLSYAAFQLARSQGLPGFPFCVKNKDFAKPKRWEVCVGRLEGDLVDARLKSGPTKANLAPATGGLEAALTFGKVDQKVDVTLGGVFIRWKDNPFCTTVRLSAQVEDETIAADPSLAAWATCRATNARATKIKSADPFPLPLAENASSELFDVRDGGRDPFVVPDAARTPEGDVGTCAEAWLNPAVNTLLGQYYAPLEETFEQAWFEDTPRSPFAIAADLLLSPVEHGTFDVPLQHRIISEVASMGALVVGANQPVDGLWFRLSTDAHVKNREALVTPPQFFVLPAANPPSWSEDGMAGPTTPFAFDVAFSTTTGALNQVLRELSATDRMRFGIEPAPSGVTFGEVLALAAPAELGALTSPTLEWHVWPKLAPFTWMLDDPVGPIAPGRVPIAYHMIGFVVDGVEPGTGGAPDELLLRLEADFHDPDLGLAFGDTPGNEFLVPELSQPLFAATVVENALGTCPMQPHVKGNELSCDRRLEVFATLALRPLVSTMMADLLSDYPAPQFFDSQGEAPAPVQIAPLDTVTFGNRITLYGALPPG